MGIADLPSIPRRFTVLNSQIYRRQLADFASLYTSTMKIIVAVLCACLLTTTMAQAMGGGMGSPFGGMGMLPMMLMGSRGSDSMMRMMRMMGKGGMGGGMGGMMPLFMMNTMN